ncbi:MAG: TonB family protein [Bryobacterales bacterium]|nr:TonB family protein [Bryobacterales bacterium]
MLPAFRKYWHGDQGSLDLLLDHSDQEQRRRHRLAASGAVLYQLLLILFALNAPGGAVRNREFRLPQIDLAKATPLVAPRLPKELTQRDPNKGKVAHEFDLASLLPRPPVDSKTSDPGRPAPRQFQLPSPGSAPAAPTIEAPKIEVPQPGQLGPGPGALGVPVPPQEKPKLAFERVGTPQGSPGMTGSGVIKPKLEPPKSGIEEASRGALRRGSGMVVGDPDMGAGAIEMRQMPTPGKSGSSLELLSDPQGVDFKPYLVQILAAVRRNWMSVMPESARLGRSGRVAIQFAIDKSGRVPKLVIAVPSGADALDRAAVAGISASNPFPPLPPGFSGDQIRLQLNFAYNMPSR